MIQELPDIVFELVILTNAGIPPAHILSIIPIIKISYPDIPIIVLSGYCPEDLLTDLKQKGIDGFLSLPFEEAVLHKEITKLLAKPSLI